MLDNNQSIPRLRTVAETARELKEMDPHTGMTAYHVRRLCLDGVIPTVKAGKKILLNFDTLLEYMQDPAAEKFKPSLTATAGRIRRVV